MSSGDGFAAALAEVSRVLDVLGECDATTAPDAAIVEWLETVEVLATRLDGERLRVLGEFHARGLAAERGAVSTVAWLRHHVRMSSSAAAGRVAAARIVRRLPAFSAAMSSGEVGLDHARVVAELATDLPDDLLTAAEPALLDVARTVDPGAMRRLTAHLRHSLDPEAVVVDEGRRFMRRRLHVSPTFDGMVALDGLLDPVSGATLLAALEPLTTPAGQDDDRTAPQRRADALTHLARAALDEGRIPAQGGQRPHLSLVVDAATLRGEAGARGAELDRVGVVSGEAARRIGCDASLSTAATGRVAAGVTVLDVGRRHRLVGDQLRRALKIRDGGCVFPGCDRPPEWCDAHHLVHWAHGGETSLANTALLCRWHHTYVHEGGWRLRRDTGGGWTASHPDGRRQRQAVVPTLAPP